MTANKKSLDNSWDPDTAPEWPDEVWDRAQISIGGKVIREATGTLTKRGRPPLGDEPKQQVTLRLPREVIAFFKAGGPGWQTRIGNVLEREERRAKNSGDDHRAGAVDKRGQVENSKSGQHVKRNRDHDSKDGGEFMDIKQDDQPFKGVAKEPDARRKGGS